MVGQNHKCREYLHLFSVQQCVVKISKVAFPADYNKSPDHEAILGETKSSLL